MIFHPSYDPLLSLKDAAKYLAMSPSHLSRLARRREIEVIRPADSWSTKARLKFRLSSLNAWAKRYTIKMRDRGTKAAAAPEGFIFFAQISDSQRAIRQYIKMDFCYSAHQAKTALQTASPFPLVLLALMPGSLSDLNILEARFEHLRAPDGVRWYAAKGDLIEFIQDLPKTPPRQKPLGPVKNQTAQSAEKPTIAEGRGSTS